jgi:hypothetical protein
LKATHSPPLALLTVCQHLSRLPCRNALSGRGCFIPVFIIDINLDYLLRRLFERLGATYVKLGQFVASSPTLFPAEYVTEFQKCLDQTPTIPFSTVREILAKELGSPLDSIFSSIDEVPIASASIAQVRLDSVSWCK